MTGSRITIRFGGGGADSWNDELLDRFCAPEVSTLTHVDAPELSESEPYFATFFLNRIFRHVGDLIPDDVGIMLGVLLRRVAEANRSYMIGRDKALIYVGHATNNHIDELMLSIGQFEQCIASARIAFDISVSIQMISEKLKERPKRRPLHERIANIDNAIKHFDEWLALGNSPYGKAPLWLTPTGIRAARQEPRPGKQVPERPIHLSYRRLAHAIECLQRRAKFVSSGVFSQLEDLNGQELPRWGSSYSPQSKGTEATPASGQGLPPTAPAN
jgi:hypothetical protein